MLRRLVPFLLLMMALICLATHGALNLVMRQAVRVSGPALPKRTEIAFRVDSRFTSTERALIVEALKEIERVSGCIKLTPSFVLIKTGEVRSWRSDKYSTIYRASKPLTWQYHTARFLTGPGSYMGVAMITTGDMFIMASENGEGHNDFLNTIIHETLHVIFKSGWHSPREGSLMYQSIGGGKQRLFAEEIAALRAMCVLSKTQKVVLYEVRVSYRHPDARPAAVSSPAWRMVQ